MTRLRISIDDAAGIIQLRSNDAPRGAERLWTALPLSGVLRHSAWSGACVEVAFEPLRTSEAVVEHPISFIYPGALAYRADLGLLAISHGQAQWRTAEGPDWISYIGDLVEGRDAVFEVLSGMRTGGTRSITLRRDDGS